MINKKFFLLFFEKAGDGYYIPRKTEESIKKVFSDELIAELNRMYYQKKKEDKIKEAQEIAENVSLRVKNAFAA
jgi:hypothetical protein